MEDDNNIYVMIFIVFALFLILCEFGFWTYIFMTSDKIECNQLWCTATKKLSYEERYCFMNGEPVECLRDIINVST